MSELALSQHPSAGILRRSLDTGRLYSIDVLTSAMVSNLGLSDAISSMHQSIMRGLGDRRMLKVLGLVLCGRYSYNGRNHLIAFRKRNNAPPSDLYALEN